MSSFLPAKKNFPFWKDATFRYLFEWRDEIEKVVKPHDLTGYTGACTIVPVPGETGAPIVLTTENGGVIFGGYRLEEPTNGIVELYVTKAQFEAVEWSKANYTLYATEPESPHDDYPLLTGRFTQAGPPL
jgi:hypothetical protein